MGPNERSQAAESTADAGGVTSKPRALQKPSCALGGTLSSHNTDADSTGNKGLRGLRFDKDNLKTQTML